MDASPNITIVVNSDENHIPSLSNAQITPFIKKFRTQSSHYIYDVNTNRILFVSPAMYDIVDFYWQCSKAEIVNLLVGKYSPSELNDGYSQIHNLAANLHLFSSTRLDQRIQYFTEEEIKAELDRGVMQICLEVTEACNLRCKYCAFSGGYHYNRTHSNLQMDFPTAKTAVDFYLHRNINSDDSLSISFYGGEPLLRFDLIREVINYAKSIPIIQKHSLRFNLTTNGILLNEEIMKYFIENQVSVTISLDGPQREHDRHRVYKNGHGTFNKVIENIKKFRLISSEEYFLNSIRYNCVLPSSANLLEVNEFFSTQPELFRKGSVMVSGVSAGNPDFFKKCESYPNRKLDMASLNKAFCDTHAHLEQHDLTFISNLFEKDLILLHKRYIRDVPRVHDNISPACFPGSRKLFVTPDGYMHICERINHHFPIGNVFFHGLRLSTAKGNIR